MKIKYVIQLINNKKIVSDIVDIVNLNKNQELVNVCKSNIFIYYVNKVLFVTPINNILWVKSEEVNE